jgi:hypothetical protein
MKRSGPPKRSTPLARGKPLASTRITATVPRSASRRRDTGPSVNVRKLVDARCGAQDGHPGICEWPGCTRQRVQRHHRLNRKSGGRHGDMRAEVNSASYLLGSCAEHHDRVTSAVGAVLAEARTMGWVLLEGQDARLVPVLTRHSLAPIMLDDAGGWQLDPHWGWGRAQAPLIADDPPCTETIGGFETNQAVRSHRLRGVSNADYHEMCPTFARLKEADTRRLRQLAGPDSESARSACCELASRHDGRCEMFVNAVMVGTEQQNSYWITWDTPENDAGIATEYEWLSGDQCPAESQNGFLCTRRAGHTTAGHAFHCPPG